MKLKPHKYIYKYIKKKLIKNNNFKEFSPNSLIYKDKTDQIIIYINSSNMIIIHDGKNIDHGIEMIQVIGVNKSDKDIINAMYLQPILLRS